MLNELQHHYDTLENARLTLIRKVRKIEPQLLQHKPGPDRWSILEDFQHLVLAEQKTVLKARSDLDSEEKNPDMFKMVLQVLDQNFVVDVPDPDMLPDGNATLEDLIQDWEQARKRLLQFLENCGSDNLDKPVSSHPVTGPLTVVECLRLLASHFDHHRRRIEAAIEHS